MKETYYIINHAAANVYPAEDAIPKPSKGAAVEVINIVVASLAAAPHREFNIHRQCMD